MGGHVPLGYEAEGRTLKINTEEAKTIRILYELYLELGCIREVKEQAARLGLRTKRRIGRDGRTSGGRQFGSGHIHQILANPIYSGMIRHKGNIYDGQQPAIIDPDIWDQVQLKLENGSAKARGSKQKASKSALAGIVFDETGDRLTPSHSKKNGKRLRYYISRRLVVDRASKHPDAWQLPAEDLEGQLARLVQRHLAQPETITSITVGLGASELLKVSEKLKSITSRLDLLSLIERVDLRQGRVSVRLGKERLTVLLDCDSEQITAEDILIEAPFRTRRRGVELKLHLGDAPAEIDKTLVRNIVQARRWLNMVIDGQSFIEIAETEATSSDRIQHIIDFVFLAPEVLDAVAAGHQPSELTSTYMIKNGFSAVWSEQIAQFAKL